MKKIVLRLLFILIMLSLVGACARADSPAASTQSAVEIQTSQASPNQANQTAAPSVLNEWEGVDPSNQRITFWHIFTDQRQQAFNDLVENFNANNSYGIQVTASYQGSYADIYNKMLSVVGTGSAPDLLITFQNQAAEYQLKGGLVDLTSLIASQTWGLTEEEQAVIFPGIWSADIYPTLSNQRLGIPFYRSVDMLYYNVDWLSLLGYQNPPATLDEFAEMACAADKAPFISSEATQSSGTVFYVDASRLASWVFASGGDIYNYRERSFDLDNDVVRNVLNFQQKLIVDKCAVESTSWAVDQNLFMQGKTLFITGSSSLIRYFTQSGQQGTLNFYWAAAPFPHSGSQVVSNAYNASVSVGKSTPERELAAFIFIKYLLSKEVQAQWASATGELPVRSDVADLLGHWFADYPWYQTAYSQLALTKSEPPLPGYDFVRQEIEDATSAILEGGDANKILGVLNGIANSIVAEKSGQ